MIKLNQLREQNGARPTSKRLGRGHGSGKGKTSGRGHKGYKSRAGSAVKGFEGGQMPLHMRLPKRGFRNIFAKRLSEVTMSRLNQALAKGVIKTGEALDEAALLERKIVRRRRDGIRLIGNDEVTASLQLTVSQASSGAVAAIEKAGGSVTVTAPPQKKKQEPAQENS